MTDPIILLFDIDGTLVSAQGAGRRALNRAFEQAFGVVGAIDCIELQGMTDPLIVRAGLEAIQIPTDAHSDWMDRLIERYLGYLVEELSPEGTVQRLPGVVDLLERLRQAQPHIALGLGTGNVAAGARAKLERAGLFHYFDFGGYGSDHELRSSVLAIGAKRGADSLGRPIGSCRIIVIGDTHRDVEAARAIGADCLGVATGHLDVKSLEEAGASLVVESLAAVPVYGYLTGQWRPHSA